MYPVETSSEAENDGMPTKQATESTENDPATDGHHTQVTDRDGTKEWLTINNYLPKSTIDPTNLVCQENIMKYYEDDKQTSYMGVDVSKYNTYVDYEALKKAGVQFVMIRVGARGYSSGNITMDDYFANNIKQASDAGLDIGLTFFSQAINVEEAQAEAQTVLSSIGEYQVNYPIAIDMEYIPDDTSRIENTNAEQKTTIIKAFCDAIKAAGYNPMIYGDKEWLLKEIHLTKLTGYDVWLAQNEDTPDYPYKFTMWQYATDETIDGISGNANLDISFIDFALK
jgi:GH25 family lysozyme M1 (1,4-beta-N-acetylmuramidase)